MCRMPDPLPVVEGVPDTDGVAEGELLFVPFSILAFGVTSAIFPVPMF